MKIRTMVAAAGLCVTALTAGCADSVAGQAQIASGAALPTTSNSAPSPFPDPSGGESSGSTTSTAQGTSGIQTPSSTPSTDGSAAPDSTDGASSPESSSTPAGAGDSSVGPAPSVPGLSKDCDTVLAGITAFTKVLQDAGASGTISQAAVDEALGQLPASGLPARPQADISILRATVFGAGGKTLAELGGKMTDGKVVAALQDLSSWAESNCT